MYADIFNEFQDKLMALFRTKGISEECPYCHKTDWLLMDWNRNGAYIKPERQVHELGGPFIMLTCANCGNIRFIDPYALGLISEGDPVRMEKKDEQ